MFYCVKWDKSPKLPENKNWDYVKLERAVELQLDIEYIIGVSCWIVIEY